MTELEGKLLFPFEPSQQPKLMSPLALAHVGDAVHSLFIRQYLLSLPNHRPNALHRRATQFVSAKAQAKALEVIHPHLTEEEAEYVRRGRNAKSATTPKHTDVLDYRYATALECLIGYLYLSGNIRRITELLFMTIPSD